MLIEKVGEPAALELLAEECVELAHAALKLARIERGENPSPLGREECIAKVIEEMADLRICLDELMSTDWFDMDELMDMEIAKRGRMDRRLKDVACRDIDRDCHRAAAAGGDCGKGKQGN